MINTRTNRLEIFTNFEFLNDNQQEQSLKSGIRNIAEQIVKFNTVHPEDLYIFQEGASVFSQDGSPNKFSKRNIKQVIKSILRDIREIFTNPIKYFERVKSVKRVIKPLIAESEKNFNTLREQAQTCHQIALVEKLNQEETRIKREFAILNAGIKTFIAEDDLIVISTKNLSRKIRLDWIKNFTRVIPVELQKIINYTYSEKLFDNYVILHYDPVNMGSAMTESDKKKAADPILFGVFKGSTRLYYLGDWIDEYCDLTLDKLLDIINVEQENRKLEAHIL